MDFNCCTVVPITRELGVLRAEWMTNHEPGTRTTPTSDDSRVANIDPF